MSEKSEDLRLADRLEGRWALHPEMQEAAAELRRLRAQRDALLDEIQTHSAAVYECTRLLAEAREQRDALLEVVDKLEYSFDGYIKRYPDEAEVNAAIKAVEEGK